MLVKPRPLRAVFFDAGQTLLELCQPVAQTYFWAITELGIDIDQEAFRHRLRERWPLLNAEYRSKNPDWESSETLERQAWRDFTRSVAEPFPELLQRHHDWHGRLVTYFDSPLSWKPTLGSLELLHQLKQQEIQVGVISNWHSALRPILDHHGLSTVLDFVLISSEVGRKKPHPRMFQQALAIVGAEPEEVVHVGDSWHDDVEGSLAVGISAVWLETPSAASAAAKVPTAGSISDVADWLRPRIAK
jgi:putative hydrolase of the HAD superfamily